MAGDFMEYVDQVAEEVAQEKKAAQEAEEAAQQLDQALAERGLSVLDVNYDLGLVYGKVKSAYIEYIETSKIKVGSGEKAEENTGKGGHMATAFLAMNKEIRDRQLAESPLEEIRVRKTVLATRTIHEAELEAAQEMLEQKRGTDVDIIDETSKAQKVTREEALAMMAEAGIDVSGELGGE